MMLTYSLYPNLNKFFEQELYQLNCLSDTKAYIVSIFDKYKSQDFDYSKESLTLLFSKARNQQNFMTFQNIGDWIFFCEAVFPESLNAASDDYYQSLARMSYYQCYRIIDRKWMLYENMADDFKYLTKSTRKIIRNI